MKTKVSILYFFFLSTIAFSQTITGKILDIDNQPISFVNILINKSGTISNDEGDFTIDKSKFKEDDKVVISCLGYKNIEILVVDLTSKTYILEEDINELSEIEVSNKVYSVKEILALVKERIDSNYLNTPTKKQIFTRNSYATKFKRFEFEFLKATLLNKKALKEVNKSFKALITDNIDKSSKSFSEGLSELYMYTKEKQKLNVIKATTLLDKEKDKSSDKLQKEMMNIIAKHLEKGATYKVSSGLFPVEDSLKIEEDFNSNFYKEKLKTKNLRTSLKYRLNQYSIKNDKKYDFIYKTKKYTYTLIGTATYDNEKVYIINFSPKRSSAKHQGTLYINAFDFAVVKLTYGYAKGKEISKNLKFLLGVKYAVSKNDVTVYFHKNNMDFYSLKFFKVENASYGYVNRSLKFKKNRKDRSEDKRVIKMEFLVEMDNYNKNEFYVLDEQELSKTDFESFKEKKEYKLNYISKYSPDVWKGYNVISPVEEIKNYNTGD